MSIRDLLLKPVEPPTEVVPLPELGEGAAVTVRGMTTSERGQFETQFIGADGKQDRRRVQKARERMLVACCIDDAGKRIFTLDDVAALGLQSGAIIDRIYEACQRVNGGMTVEDQEKNSEETSDC